MIKFSMNTYIFLYEKNGTNLYISSKINYPKSYANIDHFNDVTIHYFSNIAFLLIWILHQIIFDELSKSGKGLDQSTLNFLVSYSTIIIRLASLFLLQWHSKWTVRELHLFKEPLAVRIFLLSYNKIYWTLNQS